MTTKTKRNETKQSKTGQNGAIGGGEEKTRDCKLPFSDKTIYNWISDGINKDYGFNVDISDLSKSRGMYDVICQLKKKSEQA